MSKATKEQLAFDIVLTGLTNALTRQEILGQLRVRLNMGVPGAQTYFQKVVKQATEARNNAA